MNAKAWLHSLVAAAVGGAVSSLLAIARDHSQFNFNRTGMANLALVAAGGAGTAVLALLKQSPLPTNVYTVQSTETVTATPQEPVKEGK